MRKKILLSSLALCLGSSLNAASFFTTDFDNHYKSFDDEIKLFFNNDSFFRNSYPKINIFENKKYYTFKFELPGIDKKDIRVSISHQNILTVSGSKKELSKSEKKEMIKQEHFYGSFSRSISLPDDINSKDIKVTYKNGILTITVQKDLKKRDNRTRILTIE